MLRRLALDRVATYWAVRLADTSKKQPEVVVNLSDRSHGRSRIARGGLLIDRDCRAQSFDEVNVRLIHLAQELSSVGRQTFHVAALTFGKNCVEREAGFPRARKAGENDEGIAWQIDGDVFEVVLSSTSHHELIKLGTVAGASLSGRRLLPLALNQGILRS